MMRVAVVGAGLAGSEAAWQLARRGVRVRLHEMRPGKLTPAHRTGLAAELVCSNSFKSDLGFKAHALLKEELRSAGSLVLACADATRVPAGEALAVDRGRFAARVTESLAASPQIERVEGEVASLEEAARGADAVVLATGPLTSDALAGELLRVTGSERLYFYDSIAPVVAADSVDAGVAFRASRHGRGGDDYVNCPLDEEQYRRLVAELRGAEKVPAHGFEDARYFEACLPVEVMAERGERTLAYGPMKPVGLVDPRTGAAPFACVQLRQENLDGTALGLVGFQTRLTYPEQGRVLRLIPGLERAEFLRYGSVHRNTYVDAPRVLDRLALRADPRVRLAGQLTGVEGYLESTAVGLLAAVLVEAALRGVDLARPPRETALGALLHHVSGASLPGGRPYQPTNVNWGLFPPLERRVRRADRPRAYTERARGAFAAWARRAAMPPPPPPGPPPPP